MNLLAFAWISPLDFASEHEMLIGYPRAPDYPDPWTTSAMQRQTMRGDPHYDWHFYRKQPARQSWPVPSRENTYAVIGVQSDERDDWTTMRSRRYARWRASASSRSARMRAWIITGCQEFIEGTQQYSFAKALQSLREE